MASVKCVEETTYKALRTDGYADAVAFYNDNITIDKASAPGAKPYYRSRQSSDVFYDGSRICCLHVPVKKDKDAKVSFQQTYKAPEHFCNINLTSPYKINKGTTSIKVPAPLAGRIKVEPYCLPENIVLSRTAMPDGSVEYIATITNLPAWKPEKGAPRYRTPSRKTLPLSSSENTTIFREATRPSRTPGAQSEDASLLSLTKNVQTPVGMFVTGAKKSDDGRSVTVAARSRISHPTISIAGWPHVLDLTDAKADFADAVIILKKK